MAVDATIVSDGGPYTGNSPRVIDQACIFCCGPYRVPSVHVVGKSVVTNNPLGGAFRGYGINQPAVAMEQLMDELALTLGMDPFELRRINMLVEGDETITGHYLTCSVGAIPTLDAAKAAFEQDWPEYAARARPGYRVGFGVAAGYKNVGVGKGKPDDSGGTFTLLANGRIELRASVVDMGEAIRTTMTQLGCQIRHRLPVLRPDNPGHRQDTLASVGLRRAPDPDIGQRRVDGGTEVQDADTQHRGGLDRGDAGRIDARWRRRSHPVVEISVR